MMLPATVTTALRLVAGIGFGLLLWQGASAVWQLKTSHEQLRASLATTTAERNTAMQQAASKGKQLDWLQGEYSRQQQDSHALLGRLETINQAANNRAARLEAIIHADIAAKAWADTPLPAAVAGVLDNTGQPDPAGANPDRAAELPAGDTVPPAAPGA